MRLSEFTRQSKHSMRVNGSVPDTVNRYKTQFSVAPPWGPLALWENEIVSIPSRWQFLHFAQCWLPNSLHSLSVSSWNILQDNKRFYQETLPAGLIVHWWHSGKESAVPGSSPGRSRVIRRWGRSRCLWKNTYLITDIERLEMDSVVGRLVERKRLNNLDYME